jgi:hypothetical protein
MGNYLQAGGGNDVEGGEEDGQQNGGGGHGHEQLGIALWKGFFVNLNYIFNSK